MPTITSTIQSIIDFINDPLVPLVFAAAFIMFLFGVYRGFIAGGANDKSRAEGRQYALWAVVGMAIMLSVWGLVNLLLNSFGNFGGSNQPKLPTFGANGGSSQTDVTPLPPPQTVENPTRVTPVTNVDGLQTFTPPSNLQQ